MDDETVKRLTALKEQETDAHNALTALLDENGALVADDQHPNRPSPSYNEKLMMRERLIVAHRELQEIQEQIREIDWDVQGIVEGESLVLGVDNIPRDDETHMLMSWHQPKSIPLAIEGDRSIIDRDDL